MKTVELGRTGEQVSRLALGCMLMGGTTDEATANRILDRYVAAGGTMLDTADCYTWWDHRGTFGGQSEEVLGRWLARTGRRDEVFLATKGSAAPRDPDLPWDADGNADWDVQRAQFAGAGADTLRAAVDGSLRRLGVDHVDLYYVHVDDRSTPLEETLEALAGIVAAGKARYLGYSNVAVWRLERIRQLCDRNGWPAPVAVQQQHTYLRPNVPGRAGGGGGIVTEEQLDYLRENVDVSLVAYSPILKGVYDDPAKRTGHWAMAPYVGPDADARIAALERVAAEVGARPNQVVLAWLLQSGAPTVIPLIGPRTYEQLESALAALDVTLTADQLRALDAAGA